jgi:hypothetical protein
MVADPKAFFGPSNRNGLVGWLPLNEHPDEGRVAEDVSSTSSDQTVTGFTLAGSFADRRWSEERGWYLNVPQGGTVFTDDYRTITDEYSLSLWMMPEGSLTSSGTSSVFTHGPVRLELPDQENYAILSVFNIAGTHHPIQHLPMQDGTFSNVLVTLSGSMVRSGVAAIGESLSLATTDMTVAHSSFDTVGHDLVVSYGSNRGYGLQDVRIWNLAKEQEAVNTIHDYNPTPTICTYWPTNISVVSSEDRYGLKKTPAGFVYPDKMPPAVRMNQLARITRYDDMGRYQGEKRFNEVGLGGGTNLPQTYTLGQLFYNLTATGTTVVSGFNGQLPGYNQEWFDATGFGVNWYIDLPFSGSGATGIAEIPTPLAIYPGEPVYWPHQTQSTNPCIENAWIKADNGTLYEFTLRSVGTASADVVGTNVPTTGAETVLSAAGTVLTCNVYGTVYQKFDGSVLDTPPLYMYLNSRVKDDVDDAHTTWTEKNDTNLFGNKQTPQVAALDENGILEFENTSTLEPGRYRLTINSGNIGKVDSDFDGYSVEINVGDFLIIGRLAVDGTGTDFTASDVFEFELTEEVAANWFLTITWLNAFSNPSRGVARKMAIFGYTVEKIQSELYQVTINTTGTGETPLVESLNTRIYSGTVPGGWLASINSYGSVVRWRHESVVFPRNDTVAAVVPLSNTLTSNTAERKEDQILKTNTGSNVLPDAVTPPFPVFTSITVT